MTKKINTSFEAIKSNEFYRSVVESIEDEEKRKIIEDKVFSYVTALEKALIKIQKKTKEGK